MIIVIIVLYFTVNSDDFKKYVIINASISAVLMFIAIIVKLVDKFVVKKDKTEEEAKPIQPTQPNQPNQPNHKYQYIQSCSHQR